MGSAPGLRMKTNNELAGEVYSLFPVPFIRIEESFAEIACHLLRESQRDGASAWNPSMKCQKTLPLRMSAEAV